MKGDLTAENLIVGSTNIITEINTKQNIINDNDLSISKTLNLQSSLTNLQDNINLKQNILTSGTNITIDENNVISSSGGGSINQSELDLKQNILNDITQNSIKSRWPTDCACFWGSSTFSTLEQKL